MPVTDFLYIEGFLVQLRHKCSGGKSSTDPTKVMKSIVWQQTSTWSCAWVQEKAAVSVGVGTCQLSGTVRDCSAHSCHACLAKASCIQVQCLVLSLFDIPLHLQITATN